MRTLTPAFVLLAGCGFGLQPATPEGIAFFAGTDSASGDADTDTDSDTDTDTDADIEPEIESIEPTWGTTAGGTLITLYGTFDEDASIRVGGSEADIVDIMPRKGIIEFETPEAGDEGTVNVVLDSNDQTAKLEDGFTYYLDGSGLIGLVGAVNWTDQVGDYWSSAPIDSGYAFMAPVKPGEFDWGLVYAASLDTCESNLSYTYAASLEGYDLGAGSTATLAAGSKTIDLTWDSASGQFVRDSVVAGQFAAGDSYDLTELEPADDVMPAYTANGLVNTPASFTVNAPNIGGAQAPQVSRTMAFSWSGGAPGDGVFITLGLVNSAGTAYQEEVTCHVRDDGSFNLPSSAFEGSWPVDRQINIIVARYKLSSATIPYNDAGTAVIGEYAIFGAGFTK